MASPSNSGPQVSHSFSTPLKKNKTGQLQCCQDHHMTVKENPAVTPVTQQQASLPMLHLIHVRGKWRPE